MTTRDLSSANATQAGADVQRVVIFVELDFASGYVRVHSWGGVTLSFDCNGDGSDESFTGLGDLGGMGEIEESQALQSYSVTLTLAAITASNVSIALQEEWQGRPGKIWLGFLDADGALVADPTLIFRGRIDTMDGQLGGSSDDNIINVTIINRLADLERPRIRRFTNEDQQERYPGDEFFEFVPEMVEREIPWGIGDATVKPLLGQTINTG